MLLERTAMSHLDPIRVDDLQALHPLLRQLVARSGEVIGLSQHAYAQCTKGGALLGEDFSEIILPSFRRSVESLLSGDLELFRRLGRELGEQLAGRRIPFFEVMLCLHVRHETIATLWPENLGASAQLSFSQVFHLHAMFVAEGYILAGRDSGSDSGMLGSPDDGLDDCRQASFHGLIGASPAMRRVFNRILAASRTRGTVLIVGESGTGKELAAHAIHRAGPNPEAPFVAVNCAAISRDLIESELFGHRRGSFSGASGDHLGLFRAADGGTILLDEVTEMSLATQSKLLRVLQERMVRPVGSVSETPVNVRVIASTNRRPEHALRQGVLREDLYYRLQANVIELPPLRERPEDIPLLTSHFIQAANEKGGRATPVSGIAQDAMAALLRHSWPGNVRELSNCIESAVTFGRGARIRLSDIPEHVHRHEPQSLAPQLPEMPADREPSTVKGPLADSPKTFEENERELIERALQMAGHNKTYAAELLKISRKKLYARLAKYGMLNQGRRLRRVQYDAAQSVACAT
jgi:DNA-binding NtrC family response regulator